MEGEASRKKNPGMGNNIGYEREREYHRGGCEEGSLNRFGIVARFAGEGFRALRRGGAEEFRVLLPYKRDELKVLYWRRGLLPVRHDGNTGRGKGKNKYQRQPR